MDTEARQEVQDSSSAPLDAASVADSPEVLTDTSSSQSATDSPPISAESAPKRSRNRPARFQSRLPAHLQGQIILQASLNEPHRAIARNCGVSPGAVLRVTKSVNMDELRHKGRELLSKAIAPATKAVLKRVKRESKSDKGIATHSMFTLKATGVSQSDGNVILNAQNAAVLMGNVPSGWEQGYAVPTPGSVVEAMPSEAEARTEGEEVTNFVTSDQPDTAQE